MSVAASRQLAVSSSVDPEVRGDCPDASPPASAAAVRFRWAIRLVKTLLSSIALYSSGPVTPSMRNRPSAS